MKTLLTTIIFCFTATAFSQNITVVGNYVDQLGNPLSGATVKYYHAGSLLDSLTLEYNSFEFNIPSVGIDNPAVPNDYKLEQNFPNPFNPETQITVSTLESGTVTIFNILGQMIDRINLPNAGNYKLSWGGGNYNGTKVSAGIYLYILKTKSNTQVKKMTLLDSGSGTGLQIISTGSYGQSPKPAGKLLTLDEIRFNRENSTPLTVQFNSPVADTSLGFIVGNIGPTVLANPRDTTIYVGDTLSVNFLDFVYNDDRTWFSDRNSILPVFIDSLLFIPQQPDTITWIIDATDSTDSALNDSLVFTVIVDDNNFPPVQIANIPDQSIDEDSSLVLDLSLYVNDPNGDSLSYFLNSFGQEGYYWSVSNNLMNITYFPQEWGTIENLIITASDNEYDLDLNPFDLIVNPVNDAPGFYGVISDANITLGVSLLIYLTNYFYDSDNDTLSYSINLPDSIWSVAGETLTITPVQTDTLEGIIITADDGELQTDSNPFTIEFSTTPIVHFVMKDYYTDSTLVSDTSTWWIGDSVYYTTNGELDIELIEGTTYEFNATNENTIDGISPLVVDFYLFLRRPSDTECFEQRARDDYSSPITITNDDTIHVYKLMNDFPMMQAFLYVGSPGTVRFSEDHLDAPAWMNLNYDAPDSLTLARMNRLWTVLYEATGNKLDMQYVEGTDRPTVPNLGMNIGGNQGPVNATGYNVNNEITFCSAQFLSQPSGGELWIEVIQAVTDLYDSGGVDAPIISYDNEGRIYINELGQKLLKFIYFVNPKTKI